MAGRIGRVLFVVAAVAAALWWALSSKPGHQERDIVQERLDQASPPLTSEHTVGQTFVSGYSNLRALEFLVARYEPDTSIPADARVTLRLERLDAGVLPTVVTLSASPLEHNQTLRFDFPPLADSLGASYRATLSSNGDHGIGFWHAGSDAYAGGELMIDESVVPGDLRLISFYDYTAVDVLRSAGRLLLKYAGTLPALLLLLLVPGLLVTSFWPLPSDTPLASRLGLIGALSLAFWPLLLLWVGSFGLTMSPVRAWLLLFLMGATIAYRWRAKGVLHTPLAEIRRSIGLAEVVLGLVMVVTITVRLIEVRDLVVPAWVDSVHHTVITQMIVERGVVPDSCLPYVAIEDFHYHFGFHANAAFLSWLTRLQPYQSVLLFGQVLNALAALAVYPLASRWSGRRWAGVVAALTVGALNYMPAYYASWGRYTQLAGLVLLPGACLAATWAMRSRNQGPRTPGIAALLAAGIGVTHYRVLLLYCTFWLCYPLAVLARERFRRGAWQRLARSAGLVAAAAIVLILPWAVRFVAIVLPSVGTRYGGWSASTGVDTSVPWGLLDVGWTRPVLYVAMAGLVWSVIRRRWAFVLLGFWVGTWFLMANLDIVGLPKVWLIHNSSVVISLWLPAGVLCGWVVSDLLGCLGECIARRTKGIRYRDWLSAAMAISVLVMLGWGGWRLVDIVNPVTVLVTAEDYVALEWAEENTPTDALFLINTRQWQGELRAGSDAGWWLPMIAHRAVNLPCVLYAQGSTSYRDAINGLALAVETAESLDDEDLLTALRDVGITHVFIGSRAGRLLPKDLDPSSAYELLYKHGPARIYRLAHMETDA